MDLALVLLSVSTAVNNGLQEKIMAGILYRYNGSSWDAVVGGTPIYQSSSAPSSPSTGDIWVDTGTSFAQSTLLAAESVVSGSAATTITFSGLDGVTAGGYRIIGEFVTASSSTYINAFLNGDTTATNYQSDWMAWDSTTVSANTANSPYVGYYAGPSAVCTLDMELYVMPGVNTYYNTVIKSFCNNFSSFSGKTADSKIYNVVHNSASNNLTSIALTATTTGTFAIGSTFRLYKRK